jgi:hypothetical protein
MYDAKLCRLGILGNHPQNQALRVRQDIRDRLARVFCLRVRTLGFLNCANSKLMPRDATLLHSELVTRSRCSFSREDGVAGSRHARVFPYLPQLRRSSAAFSHLQAAGHSPFWLRLCI